MADGQVHRITVSDNHKYPSPLSEAILLRIFKASIFKGRIGLQFKGDIKFVGTGEFVCTIAPPSLRRFVLMSFKPDYYMPKFYALGYWSCEEGKLFEFLTVLFDQKGSLLVRLFRSLNKHFFRDNIIYRFLPYKVRENIAVHYNTSTEFMKLILGEKLIYTCAFFEGEGSLEGAQLNKIQTIAKRLDLSSKDNVLDLGCGWGQIAEEISLGTDCNVTGVNISDQQIDYANSIKSEKTNFIHSDFMEFESEPFSKIYSIGMVEHVGKGHLKHYFDKISYLLDGNGTALIHFISRKEEGSTNQWIDEAVFPGSYIPLLSEVIEAIEKSNLEISDIFFHHSENYYRTLQSWERNFRNNREQLEQFQFTPVHILRR